MKRWAVFLLVSALAAPAWAAEGSFSAKIRGVSEGMTQDQVVDRLGEPEAVLQKTRDAYGRPVEVWRYLPGIEIPARATIGGRSDAGFASLNVPVTSSGSLGGADRARQEIESWERQTRAQVSGSAPPAHRAGEPLPVSQPVPVAGYERFPAYVVTFVNGAVADVRYSE